MGSRVKALASVIGGKQYVPWITFLGFGPKGIYWHGKQSRLEFKAACKLLALAGFGFALVKWRWVARYWHLWIEAVCKLLLGIRELISVCKVLALVNWSSLQALVWLLWIRNSLLGLALANWQQFARYWHLWIGNSLQDIGTGELAAVCKVLARANCQQLARNWPCELATVCKVLALANWQPFCKVLAPANWQQFARYWHLWIANSWQGIGPVNWQQFARYWLLWIGNSWQGIGTCELATVCKVLAIVIWQQCARNWHLWNGYCLQSIGTCELATVWKELEFLN